MDVLSKPRRTERSPLARAPAEPLLARTTRWIIHRRPAVIALWLAALLGGAVASAHLRPLLANGFAVPHTDSARAATILTRTFGDRSDGEYLLVFAGGRPIDLAIRTEVQSAVERAARAGP